MPLNLPVLRSRPLERAVRSLGLVRKAAGDQVVPGQNAGWSNARGWNARGGALATRVSSPINTYGGTDQASTWVFACVTIRSQQLAGYPWWLHLPGEPNHPIDRESRRGEVRDLYELLDEPNSEMSYFDFAEQVEMDLDLTGNSFWLLDQLNGLGQPNSIEWLMPGTTKVVTDKNGRRIGYVYRPPGSAVDIPYGLNEVMHFRNRNPFNRYYGMGVVEAILRSVDRDLAQGSHVTAFFDEGAHLSGVLTVPETIGEEEFERMKLQYEQEFNDSDKRFRVLIAEGAQSYTPISATPQVLGVVDLSRLSKDEILSGFGVPEFLLGGTGQGGVYKMEEAQNILGRAMIPVAGRFERRVKMDLTSRYVVDLTSRRKGLGYHIDPRQSDTPSAKVDRARKMVGTGASIDDMLEQQGLERLHWAGITDVPLIPSGLVPVTKEQGFDALSTGETGPNPPPNAGAGGSGTDPTNQPGGDENAGDKPPSDDASKEVEEPLVPMLPSPESALAPAPWQQPPTLQRVISDALHLRSAAQADRRQPLLPVASQSSSNERLLREFLLSQRTRALDALGQHGGRPRVTDGPLLDVAAEQRELQARVWRSTGDEGWPLSHEQMDEFVRSACSAVEGVVAEGRRRSYSPSQIAAGFPLERYRGVIGVFDDLIANVPPEVR